jgi:hypothetical protein
MSEPQNIAGNIEALGNCAYYRPAGKVTLEQASELCVRAIEFARVRRIPKLFVNFKALTGFPSPSLSERYFLARKWAAAGRGLVQLALVVQAEMIDPDKFGVTVARNDGMNADVFPEEQEALDWLLGPDQPPR